MGMDARPSGQMRRQASGGLLSMERRKEIAQQNFDLLNRLLRVVCRDNQYAGFLKASGEYTFSSDSDDEDAVAAQ